MGAADHLVAGFAGGKGVVAPAVQQQNGLPALLEVLLQGPGQGAPKGGLPRRGVLVHVHQLHLGQRRLAKALLQPVETHLLLLGHAGGLHRGRGRGKQAEGPLLPAAVAGHLPGVVAGGGLGLIGVLLLLVYDDKTQVLYRGEHRRAGAHHDGGLPPADPLPLVQALPQGETAVEQGDAVPKPAAELPDGLGGEGNLRHHDDDALPLLPHVLDEL